MEPEEKVIEVLESDTFTYTLMEVFDVFMQIMDEYPKCSPIFQGMMEKVDTREWNSFVNGITSSFILSLHINKLELKEALNLARSVGGRRVVSFVKTKNGDA